MDLIEVWSAGNITSNFNLIDLCIPRIACDFERLASSKRFLQHVGDNQLQILLQSPWICDKNEATKFKTLCTWLHGSCLNVDRTEREKHFERLLDMIDLNELPREFVIEASNLDLTAAQLLWMVEANFACLLQLTLFPLVGRVYALGGKNKLGESISRVEMINPQNGEVTVLRSMIKEREGHSAVARHHSIIVFGGNDSQIKKVLDSCEEFIPATNTWKKLPPMPTPRHSTGAAHIPGVGDIVVGGCKETGDDIPGVNIAEIFLTNSSPLGYSSSWCEIVPMLNARIFPSAEFFNGKLYVSGDLSNSTPPLEILSIFTEGPPQWTEVTKTFFCPRSMISFNGSLLFGSELSSFLHFYLKKAKFYSVKIVIFLQ
ncbi:unnamed protein product [Rodentolepis nana]|uniref:BACK domain-containing protein n=1 Tax=Rodentolepis nana TaxID=102285 RepID=A0A0R3TN98_RODNA|nr:unnamed protein product [Rodentolepis nana]